MAYLLVFNTTDLREDKKKAITAWTSIKSRRRSLQIYGNISIKVTTVLGYGVPYYSPS
jgi:hypothetical protein